MKAMVVDRDYGALTAEEIDSIRKAYEAAGIQFSVNHFSMEDELIHGCADVNVIICTGNPPVTRRVLEALPDLKIIQRTGAGVNSIDLDAATDLGRIVLNLPGFCAKEIADLAAAMILGLIRNTCYYDRSIRAGGWPKCQYKMPGDVREMTLGLFGFGGAGRYLHDIFHNGFGTRVVACDPYVSDEMKARYPDVDFVDYATLLKESDIISIHVVLTPETTHVFNRESFQKMKSSAMIINTSRGPVIDQEALIWALETGEISYAGLDTLEQEPIAPDDPLLKMDNVILSPHSGSYGAGAKKTQLQQVCAIVPEAKITGTIPARNVANRGVLKKEVGFQFV